jgi:phenylacetic acid degradation operon negative regulatory protein
VSLVPFLFGVAQRTELPGVGLIRLLRDFGLSEAAARALLLRMRQEGQVESVRRGRGAGYRLAGEYGRRFERIRAAGRAAPPVWDGSFHAVLYQVPESSRAFRDALRRAAVGLGYGQLQPGVLIATEDRSALLAAPPDDAQLFVTRLAMDLPDAARAARTAWDLDELARAFAGHAADLRAALADLDAPPAAGPQTLVRYADLLKTPMTETLRSPRLPGELLPPQWPMPALWQTIGEVQRAYGPAASAYVTTVLDAL